MIKVGPIVYILGRWYSSSPPPARFLYALSKALETRGGVCEAQVLKKR